VCGIAGWYRRRGRPVDQRIVVQQCDSLKHRGPDDSGSFVDGDFGFGMRRLSIVDVDGGRQPMFAGAGRYGVVFNGEIFNHPQLRAELQASGHVFQTRSDTETLLAAYLQWGDQGWERLEGMYAAAIWDRHSRSLTLARDPMGIKPLFITEQHDGLGFASELRALQRLPGHAFDLDDRAVHDFFTYGHVQTPRAIFRQARAVPPGHVLRIGPEGEPHSHAFWRPQFRAVGGRSRTSWVEETRTRVLGTVERHMMSDAPVGVFLSGGVDSSAIAAAMAQTSARLVKAFTIGLPGSALDESAAARQVAGHLGLDHVVVPLSPQAAADVLPHVQGAFDEPTAANSAIPLWYLSRTAAEHVKVVLCGEGGDELFAGYKRQRNAELVHRWAPLLRTLSPLAQALEQRPASRYRAWNYLMQNSGRVREVLALDTGFKAFLSATQITSPAQRRTLLEPSFRARVAASEDLDRLEAEVFGDPALRRLPHLEQFMFGDLTHHLPASLLMRLDRASMAHSLEARVPFLSHKFVDWSLTVPTDMKLRSTRAFSGKTGKYVLRSAVRPWLPAGAVDRRKRGFQLPLSAWFLGDFSLFARDAWLSSGAAQAGYLEPKAVNALFDAHRAGAANHGRVLYAIAMFSCWWIQQAQLRANAPAGSGALEYGD
jgi:asparagine synthase (glutamine-hydrolysing)